MSISSHETSKPGTLHNTIYMSTVSKDTLIEVPIEPTIYVHESTTQVVRLSAGVSRAASVGSNTTQFTRNASYEIETSPKTSDLSQGGLPTLVKHHNMLYFKIFN